MTSTRGGICVVLLVAAFTLAPATTVLGTHTLPIGPVTNGDFETGNVPPEATEPLRGTPADECIGIGHQVLFGSDTAQGDLAGGDWRDPDPTATDPVAAAERVAEDPVGEALFTAGYGHCVFSREEGNDLYWVNPARTQGPAFWSNVDSPGSPTESGVLFDDDPVDREVRIEADASKSAHNLWQNAQGGGREQAWTANFSALEFEVENDAEIPEDAYVQISLTATPLESQHGFLVIFFDCSLTFRSDLLQPGPDGQVSVDPTADGVTLTDRSDCDEAADAWDDASPGERREILGRLRIIQTSFWRFNTGPDPVVLDDIALAGATTFVEEASAGNADLETFVDEVPGSAGNGIVTMLHGRAEPETPAGPPAQEALLATRDDDSIVLYFIPYGSPARTGGSSWSPLNLSAEDPRVRVESPGLEDLVFTPNGDPSDHPRCEDETSLPGHEGPLGACLVFEIPADAFLGRNAPTMTLEWDGGAEAYNAPAHLLMHGSFEGAPVGVERADDLTGHPTPFVVENLVDPSP